MRENFGEFVGILGDVGHRIIFPLVFSNNSYGRQYYLSKQYSDAFNAFKKASERGILVATRNLGFCYEKGHAEGCDIFLMSTLPRDIDCKKEMYRDSYIYTETDKKLYYIERNGKSSLVPIIDNTLFHNNLSKIMGKNKRKQLTSVQIKDLITSNGGHARAEKSFVYAVMYYQKAISKGYVSAKKDIDRLLVNSEISPSDLCEIGEMYDEGQDVKQDWKNALIWYDKAIEKGSAAANQKKGVLYEKGRGVEKDLNTAVKYYQLAITGGYTSAQKDINRLLNKADIETKLNDISRSSNESLNNKMRERIKELEQALTSKERELQLSLQKIAQLQQQVDEFEPGNAIATMSNGNVRDCAESSVIATDRYRLLTGKTDKNSQKEKVKERSFTVFDGR